MIESLIKEFSGITDYIDCRVTNIKKETIILENSETSTAFSENNSYGVRVFYKGGVGMCSSNDFSKARSVFDKALLIAKLSARKSGKFVFPKSVSASKIIDYNIDPFSIDPKEKISKLKEFASILNKDSKIKNTNLILQSEKEERLVYSPVVNTSQNFFNNIFHARVTAQDSGIIQTAMKHYSHLGGYEKINSLDVNEISAGIIKKVNQALHASKAKPERATVVCDPEMTGLFFHEAVGHACEADAIINKASVFNGLKGKSIASSEVNLLDDPTILERGFYWYDDEGVKAKPTSLITNGVLTGFLHSLRTANELGEEPSGNGRCMTAEFPPIPRMSNTALKPGKWSFDDLINEVRNGYLVKGFAGGVVDPVTGQFSFAASECYKIINGEVSDALRDVTLAGSILDVLKNIKVGNKNSKTHLTGTCGKYGQSVRVGDYCPSILVDGVIVGGSA